MHRADRHLGIGLSPFLSRLLSACNGTEYWFASFIAIVTIEKFGRRPLMIFGAAGMSFSMAVLAGTTSHLGSSSTGIAAVSALLEVDKPKLTISDRLPLRLQFLLRNWMARNDVALPCGNYTLKHPCASERNQHDGELCVYITQPFQTVLLTL